MCVCVCVHGGGGGGGAMIHGLGHSETCSKTLIQSYSFLMQLE